MGLTITAALALFFLLAVSCGVAYISDRFRLPYTVLLVAIGTFVLVPLSHLEGFSFINDFKLSPELLFYIFLPILIFESAYNISIRNVMENIRAISALSIVSLLISALAIAVALPVAFHIVGIEIPFMVALLFGALISATDPVAVLALFKEFGAPRRLTLLFEGESIFNDGTAVALFLIVLGMAESGVLSLGSVGEGILMFGMMVVGGIAFGIIMGGIFSKLIGYVRKNEFTQITLMLVLAHLTFILTDYISENLKVGGFHIHLSAIIATTLAAMVMGNYGRAKIPPQAEEFIEKFWSQFAFLANSLVFILIGLIFASLPFSVSEFITPVLLAIVVVATSRAISVYPVTGVLNLFKKEERIPLKWSHLLAWGSLRGALAITMVLLIPDTLAIQGWRYSFSPKEFILALTIGCIFATLFIKATTIKWLMDKLHINSLTRAETLAWSEAWALIHTRALLRLADFTEKGYVEPAIAEKLESEHRELLKKAITRCKELLIQKDNRDISERIMRIYAIGIERHYLKELYSYGEITEKVYKRIQGKLTIQYEHADRGIFSSDPSRFTDTKDVFERLANGVRRILLPSHLTTDTNEAYMYYRAQSIISRKVLKELAVLDSSGTKDVFGAEAFDTVKKQYETYRANAETKMVGTAKEIPAIGALSETLARRGILKVEMLTLEEMLEKQMATPKIGIAIHEEIERIAEAQAS